MLIDTFQSLHERFTRSRAKTAKQLISIARKHCKANGWSVNPIGIGNGKTGLIGCYRPVGLTCPSYCPFLNNGCYAQGGRVHLAERRASADVEPSVLAAYIAMYVAQRTDKAPIRLQVSGDFVLQGTEDSIDWTYVSELIGAVDYLRTVLDCADKVAYTYTEIANPDFMIARLRTAGINVRRSNALQNGACYVYPHNRLSDLLRDDLKVFPCIAQTRGVQCKDCLVCATEANCVVIFDPHGQNQDSATEVALNLGVGECALQ